MKTKSSSRLRARKGSENTEAAYRVAAFQTFLSGRISTFGDIIDQLAELTVQRAAYRLLAHQALHCWHAQVVELDHFRRVHDRMRGQIQELRAQSEARQGDVV